jgi:hypothetical protein
MMRPLADAEPVPLAVAILNAKSLVRSISGYRGMGLWGVIGTLPLPITSLPYLLITFHTAAS